MAQANPKLMRAALKEALEIYEHEYCFADGTIILDGDKPFGAGDWFMRARIALGLDPITGDRKPPAECDCKVSFANCPGCIRKRLAR